MNQKPTYAELEADAGSKNENSDRDIIRTLSKSFQQLADRSQDAIYLFDIESRNWVIKTWHRRGKRNWSIWSEKTPRA
jgi:hypothetical protein